MIKGNQRNRISARLGNAPYLTDDLIRDFGAEPVEAMEVRIGGQGFGLGQDIRDALLLSAGGGAAVGYDDPSLRIKDSEGEVDEDAGLQEQTVLISDPIAAG